MTDTPRIYVASLTDYNAGTLHGAWIDADQEAEEIHEEIRAMLAASPEARRFPVGGPAEEWAIHDYEGFGELRLSEYEAIERVAELGQLIAQHGDAYAAYANYVGAEYATAARFEDDYAGEWSSEEDYAEELADEVFSIPDAIAPYFDYHKFARDLFMGDCWSADSPKGVYVFRQS